MNASTLFFLPMETQPSSWPQPFWTGDPVTLTPRIHVPGEWRLARSWPLPLPLSSCSLCAPIPGQPIRGLETRQSAHCAEHHWCRWFYIAWPSRTACTIPVSFLWPFLLDLCLFTTSNNGSRSWHPRAVGWGGDGGGRQNARLLARKT